MGDSQIVRSWIRTERYCKVNGENLQSAVRVDGALDEWLRTTVGTRSNLANYIHLIPRKCIEYNQGKRNRNINQSAGT